MEIKQIPLSLVHPSPMNPRKTFEEEALQELADNIEKQGLLQPITVRPISGGNRFEVVDGNADFQPIYEIVCGERRYRAMSKLFDKWNSLDVTDNDGEPVNHFSTITAIVREMTDEEAFDAMITENLQRKDVDPIEEAFAFGKLLETGKSAEEIALRFGKSIRFVQDRVKLNNLIPELMVAVRDGKCPIVAAMIISKLDEDGQRLYHSQYANNYQGLTKATAESFVHNMFMTLDKSLWYQSDDQADEDFEGGCNRKCAECPLNTANHGCLFYEMKSENSGKCTNRAKFHSKTIAFILKEIDRLGDTLVKKGEPLEYGKAVVSVTTDPYEGEESKALKTQVIEALKERNLEIVDLKVFSHKCFYDMDDERTLKILQNKEGYRVFSLFNYTTPTFKEECWYLNKGQAGSAGNAGLPIEVGKLLEKYKNERNTLQASITCECVKALSAAHRDKGTSPEPLTDIEKKLLMLFIIKSNYKLRRQLGVDQVGPREADYKTVEEHPNLDLYLRSWLQNSLHVGDNSLMHQAEPLLDEIGALWFPEEFQKAKDKANSKFEKFTAKTTETLAKLGYGLDGKPLIIKNDVAVTDILKQKKEMKKKHPDAILLFREGDYYNIYEEDAVKAAPILELTLTVTKIGNKQVDTCGFVHSAIDKYLPKLVRAGKRVAICEQLQDPKK